MSASPHPTHPDNPKRIAVAIELHWNLPWHLDTFQGIVDYGQSQGWDCVLDPYVDGVDWDDPQLGYDGVVGRLTPRTVERTTEAALPAVNLIHAGDDYTLHGVLVDISEDARLIGRHLASCGYRSFGYLGLAGHGPAVQDAAYQAFCESVSEYTRFDPVRYTIDIEDFGDMNKSRACREELAGWIQAQPKPIGLFVLSGAAARNLAQICLQLGFRVPEDVGIVAESSDMLTATSMSPTLSVTDFDYYEHGREAARILDRLMRGDPVHPRVKRMAASRLIVRESTDVFVCGDGLVTKAMRFIAEHSRQSLRVDEVADELCVSRRTLDRRFVDAVGRTVGQEIVRQRIQQIERLLIETQMPMTRIADYCGFNTASQFSEYFNTHTGMTPSAFRKAKSGVDRTASRNV